MDVERRLDILLEFRAGKKQLEIKRIEIKARLRHLRREIQRGSRSRTEPRIPGSNMSRLGRGRPHKEGKEAASEVGRQCRLKAAVQGGGEDLLLRFGWGADW